MSAARLTCWDWGQAGVAAQAQLARYATGKTGTLCRTHFLEFYLINCTCTYGQVFARVVTATLLWR